MKQCVSEVSSGQERLAKDMPFLVFSYVVALSQHSVRTEEASERKEDAIMLVQSRMK